MERLAGWSWRRLGANYFYAYSLFELVSAWIIAAGTVALLSLYQRMSLAEWAEIVLVSALCIAIGVLGSLRSEARRARPLLDWARSPRGTDGAGAAWRVAVALPVSYAGRTLWRPVVLVAAPVSVFATVLLHLPWYSG